MYTKVFSTGNTKASRAFPPHFLVLDLLNALLKILRTSEEILLRN